MPAKERNAQQPSRRKAFSGLRDSSFQKSTLQGSRFGFTPLADDFPDPFKYLRPLAAMGPRLTASAREKQAAAFAKESLQNLGVSVEEARFACNPSMFRPHILIFLFAVAMGALAFFLPPFPFGFLAAALGCFFAYRLYGDVLEVKPNFLTKLLPKGFSQNVVGKIFSKSERKSRLILLSHVDTALCSPIFGEKMVRNLRTNIVIDRFLLMALGLLYLAAAMFQSFLPYYLALLLSLYLLGSVFVLLYSEMFSPVSPGVNDNASGVAAVLSFAEYFSKNPLDNTEIWCVCLGAQETGANGAQELLARYPREFRESYILNVDAIGAGNPRYVINEGYHHEYRAAPELIRVFEDLSHERPDLKLSPLALKGRGSFTDATPLLRAGCKVMTLTSTNVQGYLKNWNTLVDVMEEIEEDAYFRSLETLDHVIQTLDRNYISLRGFVEEEKETRREVRKKLKPRYRLITDQEVNAKDFDLKNYLWPGFDAQSQNFFQSSAFLQVQAQSLSQANGFIILEEKTGEPVMMVPYFIYHELIDDGVVNGFLWKLSRFAKAKLSTFALPLLPGFKAVFLGTPFSQPSNRIFLKPGIELDDLLGRYEFLLKVYERAVRGLQRRYLAPVVNHVFFEKTAAYDTFFRTLGYEACSFWPDMYLDFHKIQLRLRDRLKENVDLLRVRLTHLENKLEELKVKESILLHQLEQQPEIKMKVAQQHLLLEEEDKRMLLAADAQNQIDKLLENLDSGKYIDALEQKRDVLISQRNELSPGFVDFPSALRERLFALYDLDHYLRESVKERDRSAKKLEGSREKVKSLVLKSLENKYAGSLSVDLEEKIKHFLAQKEELAGLEVVPPPWHDIALPDVVRRLEDLDQAVKKRDEECEELTKIARNLHEVKQQFETAQMALSQHHGEAFVLDLKKLFQAEAKDREIKDLAARIALERVFFEKLEQEGNLRSDWGTPERQRLHKAMEAALAHRQKTMRDLGITGGWESLNESSQKFFQDLAVVRLELRKADQQWKETERFKRKVEFDLAQKEFDLLDGEATVTFDEYVESLGVNDRNAMRRNLKRIRATETNYPLEILSTPDAIMEISHEIVRAYDSQYAANRVQWLKMTSEYFREMSQLQGVQVLVCWHLVDLNTRKFAGFILNCDQQFNHRMGIAPEYRHDSNGKTEDDHLIYFRLTLRNIEENLHGRKLGMWIAQTTYEAKKRLGFEVYPLVNYRRSTRILGFHLFSDFIYRRFMEPLSDPEVLFKY